MYIHVTIHFNRYPHKFFVIILYNYIIVVILIGTIDSDYFFIGFACDEFVIGFAIGEDECVLVCEKLLLPVVFILDVLCWCDGAVDAHMENLGGSLYF